MDSAIGKVRELRHSEVSLVSIVTPVLNASGTIARCIASVKAQTFVNWEHILVDDGSVDDSRKLILASAAADSRVRLAVHERTLGAAVARNTGIAAASGRYIAFLDADDEWLPDKLAVQLQFMAENNVDLSYGAYFFSSGRGGGLRLFEPPEKLSYNTLLGGCPIGCLTVMYDRHAVDDPRFPNIPRGQDWALWLEIARKGGKLSRHPGVHAIYRPGRHSLSSRKLAKLRDVWTIYRRSESKNVVSASYWLGCHILYVLRKRIAIRRKHSLR